ncbi:MAG: hypothetical protein PHE88_04090 [Elusimicrobia bacterium]|nr:hypothetical protein [Elusimicrobiota bacterium]
MAGFIKLLIAIILLPVLLGLVKLFFVLLISMFPLTSSVIWFISGFIVFFLIFLFKSLPGSLYVFGHELTHAFWAVLFRGKIKEFNVSSKNGNVVSTKTNFFIFLAPYFFPIYTFLLILLFYILAFFFNVSRWIEWLFFFVGITYSFHFFLTGDSLAAGQSDVKKTGRVFSYVVIIILNLITAVLILKFITPDRISFKKYFSEGLVTSGKIYKYLWEYLIQFLKLIYNEITQKINNI